jgi:hypothetical protein
MEKEVQAMSAELLIKGLADVMDMPGQLDKNLQHIAGLAQLADQLCNQFDAMAQHIRNLEARLARLESRPNTVDTETLAKQFAKALKKVQLPREVPMTTSPKTRRSRVTQDYSGDWIVETIEDEEPVVPPELANPKEATP